MQDRQGPGPVPSLPSVVAVIGAGRRGRAFALRCVAAGFHVVLEDVFPSKLREAEEEYLAQAPHGTGTLQLATSVEDAVREADLAVDFVPDELESKLEIFSMMDRMAPPRTVFCTPTVLSISDLASCTYRAERCVAVRPFDEDMASGVHVVQGRATKADVVAAVAAWFQKLGAQVEVSADATIL